MQRSVWTQPVSTDEARKRAAGRQRYNARRAFRADARRTVLAMLLRDHPEMRVTELAHDLGVSRWTIWRDVRQIRAAVAAPDAPLRAWLSALPGDDASVRWLSLADPSLNSTMNLKQPK